VFPTIEIEESIKLPTDIVSSALSRVSKAVSKDETRPILKGVLITLSNHSLRMVATDSYRLAVSEVSLDEGAEGVSVLLPGRILDDVVKVATGKNVSISVVDKQVVINCESALFITRIIEGSFPNYKQIIPTEFETIIGVNRTELINAIKRVSLLTHQNTPVRLSVVATENKLTLVSTNQELGNAQEDIFVEVIGQDVEMAYNHQFLMDGITAIQEENIEICVASPIKPGLIRIKGSDYYQYVIMPAWLS